MEAESAATIPLIGRGLIDSRDADGVPRTWYTWSGGQTLERDGVVLDARKPRVAGRDYSVYNPAKVRQGLRIWTESFIQALPRVVPEEEESRLKE